jgi:transposase
MASQTHGAQVQRLEVVETGLRRCWSEDEKLRIILESLSGPRLVSSTARRYGISPSLLYTWRRAFRAERIGSEDLAAPGFVPAMIIPEETRSDSGVSPTGRMEIVVAKGRRIIVDAGVDAAALARVIAILDRR